MDYQDAYIINGTYPVVIDNTISIGKTNECSICGGYYKYDKGYRPLDDNVYEVRILTEHPACSRINRKLEKAKAEVLDCEFELFCKKWNINKERK